MSQTPDEAFASFAEDGPISAADRWLSILLRDNDLDAAWPLIDRPCRRALANAFLVANVDHPVVSAYDREAAVHGLAEERPDHPLWEDFAETQLLELTENWAHVDLDKWGWATRPRVYSPGYEVVLLIRDDTGEGFLVEEPTPLKVPQDALSLIMHQVPEVGWLVAGFDPVVGPLDAR